MSLHTYSIKEFGNVLFEQGGKVIAYVGWCWI